MKFPKKVALYQMRAAMQAVGTVPLTTHPDDELPLSTFMRHIMNTQQI